MLFVTILHLQNGMRKSQFLVFRIAVLFVCIFLSFPPVAIVRTTLRMNEDYFGASPGDKHSLSTFLHAVINQRQNFFLRGAP